MYNTKEKVYAHVIEWRKQNYEKYLLQTCKGRARFHGFEFDLDLSDIVIPIHCPYLGIEITKHQGMGLHDSNASLDRIDNTKGYVKGNVEVISNLANKMKRNATKEQLIAFAKNILSKYAD